MTLDRVSRIPNCVECSKSHPGQAGAHPAVVVVVQRVQVALEELRLCRNQHVTGQAVSGLNLLEKVLLANPCGKHGVVRPSVPPGL